MSPSAAELHQMASIGRLLAGIVHEINTPLGSIFSNNEVLARSLDKLGPLIAGGAPEDLTKARAIVDGMRATRRHRSDRLRAHPLHHSRSEDDRTRRFH